MIGRSSHIFQIITLPFVRTTAQQQFYITDYGRERRTDIVADRQHQLLPAMEQVFGILLGFLQLLPVILAPGDITRDQNDKDHHDNQRQDSDAANEIRGFAQHLLFLHDTLHRRVHLLFFYIAQHLVDSARDNAIIITQVGGTLQKLVDKLFTLVGHTVLQIFQDSHDRVRRVEGIHQRISHDLPGRIHDNSRILFRR